MKLPPTATKVDICELLPEPWASGLRDGGCVLRNAATRRQILDDKAGCVVMDPVLRRRGYDYGWHLSDLFSRDLTEIGDPDKDVCMGMFFVKRKDELIRMIVSPEISNRLCEDPPYCPLPSTASLAELNVAPGETLTKASGDCGYMLLSVRSSGKSSLAVRLTWCLQEVPEA